MSTLTLWTRRDPFTELDALVRGLWTVPAPRPAASTTDRTRGFVPAADVTRDGDDAVVRLELPGLDVTKDVTVDVDRGRLVVHGERRDERTDEQGGLRRREVRYGGFRRSFGLPAHVTADAVTASYDAGVLTVRVAGAHREGSTARRIPVTAPRPAAEAAADAVTGTGPTGSDPTGTGTTATDPTA